MEYNQAYQSGHKGNCGTMGQGRFGGHWGQGKFGGFGKRSWGRFGQPPVNIKESETDYVISLFAAGLVKDNVTLTIKDDVLTIAYPGNESSGGDEPGKANGYTYQEHHQQGFARQFRLNNKVLTESISASYADGILKVTLPKNPETNRPAQTISVG